MLTSIRTLLDVLFFLAAGGATRDGAFLLSEAELVRIGSSVAYLDISWAKVGDLNPKSGDWAYNVIRNCPSPRGRFCILQKK
jgi:hypothetical protein